MLYGHELLNPRTNPKRSVTCHLPMFDPDMTPWGNSVVSKMLLLGKGKRVFQIRTTQTNVCVRMYHYQLSHSLFGRRLAHDV